MEESRELVRQAKKGKREAFAKLYETVYEDMYRFALYVLKDREDAEDAVAETVADAFESIGKLRKEEAFRAWIFQILSNKCKRKLKEYITKTYSYEESEQRLEKDSKTEDIAHAIQTCALPIYAIHVSDAFYSLEEEERYMVALQVFGGYKSREIAELLHKNHNTVRSQVSRALKKMKEKLD